MREDVNSSIVRSYGSWACGEFRMRAETYHHPLEFAVVRELTAKVRLPAGVWLERICQN
jgi:hypothetical protein